MTWFFTTFSYSELKDKVVNLPGLEYLYARITPDQLDLPNFVVEYDMKVNKKILGLILKKKTFGKISYNLSLFKLVQKQFFSGPWEDQLDRKMEMPPSNRPLQALFEEGEMELARQLAVEFIEAKSEKAKTALWDLKCAKQPEPIRSLVRTLVLRFHENLDPLKHALGGDGVNLAKKMTDGHHEVPCPQAGGG